MKTGWALRAMGVVVLGAVTATSRADLAERVRSSGVSGGLIVVLDETDGARVAALKLDERYLVQGLVREALLVSAAREAIGAVERHGAVTVREYDGRRLPYVDNSVNLIVSEAASGVSCEELLRVLVPRGVALVGAERIEKPWPAGMDEWTHYLHGSDNNAVAMDTGVGAPRSIQWVEGPRWGRSHEELAGMSASVSANGRVFYIVDTAPLASIRFTGQWELVARDAFNGTLLWTHPLGVWSDHLRHFRAGPVHLPRRLVAVGDSVYVTLALGAPVTAFDAATGKTLRTYEGTEATEEILVRDGVLYLVMGTSEVYRQGGGLSERNEPKATDFRCVAAVNATTGKTLWRVSRPKGEFLLPLTLTLGEKRVFCQTTAGVVCLDAGTGEQKWLTPRATPLRRMSFSAPTIVAARDVLLCADREATAEDAAHDRVLWGVNGWNEAGFPRKTKTELCAYAVDTGRELWRVGCSEGYNSPADVFVVAGTVWVGSDFKGYDLKTGALVKELSWKGDRVGMAHHRCYRDKASENYIFTGRSGIEVVSLDSGWVGNNSWIRGTCQYGIMPCNGLLYAPPDACACFSKVKVAGYFAAAPRRGSDGRMPFPAAPVLVRGKAYGAIEAPTGQGAADDWPMYRHDAARSGVAASTVPDELVKHWTVRLGGKLTQPVIADGRVFVAISDAHEVHALSAKTGGRLWGFTAGGRIDSSPTIYKGAVLFGCADGWIYALRAADGALAWRFRAAPDDMQVGAFEQLESVWPSHGSVIVQNDELYVTAGRCSYLDGGIVLYRLDPATGRQVSRIVICDLDPKTDKQKGPEAHFDMQGVSSDLLTGDGDHVYMKQMAFDRAGAVSRDGEPHLFAATGFLGEEWFVRSYWLLGEDVGTGWGGWANTAHQKPAGRILCFDADRVFGYGRVTVASGPTGHKADAYHLFRRERHPATNAGGPKKKGGAGLAPPVWADLKSLVVRAMVLTPGKLLVAGPPDLGVKSRISLSYENEDEALAAFRGERGVRLRVVNADDGTSLSEYALEAMPVFDGMSAAGHCVYVSRRDGCLDCWGEGGAVVGCR